MTAHSVYWTDFVYNMDDPGIENKTTENNEK